MTKIVLYIAQSLDGYIADTKGGIAWLEAFNQPGEDYGYATFIKTVGAAFMGASTYRQMLDLGWKWPYPAHMKAYVFSHRRLNEIKDGNVEFVSGNVQEIVEKARKEIRKDDDKRRHHPDAWLVGGGDVVRQFLEADLVDEIMLFDIPVFLGNGIPLFQLGQAGRHEKKNASNAVKPFQLLQTKKYKSGLVLRHYAKAAGVRGQPKKQTD